MQLMINIKRYTIQFHSDGHLYIYECICRIKVLSKQELDRYSLTHNYLLSQVAE